VQQQKSGISYTAPIEETKEKTGKQKENDEKRQALIRRQQDLIDQFENTESLQQDVKAETLVSLLHFYTREKKPQLCGVSDILQFCFILPPENTHNFHGIIFNPVIDSI